MTFHQRADVKIPAPPDERVLRYAAGAGTLFTADPVCFDGVKSPRGTERILWAVVLHKWSQPCFLDCVQTMKNIQMSRERVLIYSVPVFHTFTQQRKGFNNILRAKNNYFLINKQLFISTLVMMHFAFLSSVN